MLISFASRCPRVDWPDRIISKLKVLQLMIRSSTSCQQLSYTFHNITGKKSFMILASASAAIREVAQRLAAIHRPIKIDYRKRFGIDDSAPSQPTTVQALNVRIPKGFYCSKCKKRITEKVAKFCWDNKQRVRGKAYCFDCQKAFPGPR